VIYVDHIEARGRQFFEKVCELDLEGIVAKLKQSPNWVKIKNPNYSQSEGRDELFEHAQA
jgi:ATP-dependent DNA ligase